MTIVAAAPENHMQTFGTGYNPAYCGEVRVPVSSLKPLALDQRKVVARRAATDGGTCCHDARTSPRSS